MATRREAEPGLDPRGRDPLVRWCVPDLLRGRWCSVKALIRLGLDAVQPGFSRHRSLSFGLNLNQVKPPLGSGDRPLTELPNGQPGP